MFSSVGNHVDLSRGWIEGLGSGFRWWVWGVRGVGFRVWGLGFGVWSLGFRV